MEQQLSSLSLSPQNQHLPPLTNAASTMAIPIDTSVPAYPQDHSQPATSSQTQQQEQDPHISADFRILDVLGNHLIFESLPATLPQEDMLAKLSHKYFSDSNRLRFKTTSIQQLRQPHQQYDLSNSASTTVPNEGGLNGMGMGMGMGGVPSLSEAQVVQVLIKTKSWRSLAQYAADSAMHALTHRSIPSQPSIDSVPSQPTPVAAHVIVRYVTEMVYYRMVALVRLRLFQQASTELNRIWPHLSQYQAHLRTTPSQLPRHSSPTASPSSMARTSSNLLLSQPQLTVSSSTLPRHPNQSAHASLSASTLRQQDQVVSFELRVLRALLPLWLNDADASIEKLFKILDQARQMTPHAHRIRRIQLLIVSALVEVKEVAGAVSLMKQVVRESRGDKWVWSEYGRLLVQVGHLDHATRVVQHVDQTLLAENHRDPLSADYALHLSNHAMLAVAKGEWERASQLLTALMSSSPSNSTCINNLSLCTLYQGKLQESISLLESLVFTQRLREDVKVCEPVLFNLTTLYELSSDMGVERKCRLLEQVAEGAGDGFATECLKL